MQNHAVFIDSEPPSPVGGGIRTYIQRTTELLRAEGWKTRVYTHTPAAYPKQDVRLIGRVAWPARLLRGLAYRLCHEQAVGYGTSLAICNALLREDQGNTHYEFCDYNGLAYHSLKNIRLYPRIAVRIHTPLHLILAENSSGHSWLSRFLLKKRELYCLRKTPYLTCPSPDFISQHFPNGKSAEYIPNPLPNKLEPFEATSPKVLTPHFLFLGRRESRKGVLELLHAFSRCLNRHPSWKLTFVGEATDPSYEAEIKQLVNRLSPQLQPCIRFEKPFAGNKAELFQNFSFVLLPSRFENAPYAYYEAISANRMALGSATGDMGVIQKLTHGFNPIPGDVDDWEKVLEMVWEQKEKYHEWLAQQDSWWQNRNAQANELLIGHWNYRLKKS